MADVDGWKFSGITGGTATDLDGKDGAEINDGAFALVLLDTGATFYEADLTSGATADGVNVVAPVTNAGDIRWIHKPMGWMNDLGGVFFHSHLTNDPKVVQWLFGDEAELGVDKGDGTTSPVTIDMTTADFWTYIANYGAVAQAVSDDVYATVTDITGAGILHDLFLPGVTAAGDIVSVRITIDGVAHELSFTATDAGQRFCAAEIQSKQYQAPLDVWQRSSAGFIGLAAGISDIGVGGESVFIAPACRMARGMSLRFTTSLTVEMKTTDVTTSNRRDYCGATYRLDP